MLSQESGATALVIATTKGHDEVVRLLVQHGAKEAQVCVSCTAFGAAP